MIKFLPSEGDYLLSRPVEKTLLIYIIYNINVYMHTYIYIYIYLYLTLSLSLYIYIIYNTCTIYIELIMIFLGSCPFCRSSLKTLFVEIHVNYIHFYYIVKMYIYYMVSQYIYLNIGANVFEVGKFIYMYICIYIERVIISGHK